MLFMIDQDLSGLLKFILDWKLFDNNRFRFVLKMIRYIIFLLNNNLAFCKSCHYIIEFFLKYINLKIWIFIFFSLLIFFCVVLLLLLFECGFMSINEVKRWNESYSHFMHTNNNNGFNAIKNFVVTIMLMHLKCSLFHYSMTSNLILMTALKYLHIIYQIHKLYVRSSRHWWIKKLYLTNVEIMYL